MQLLQRCSAGRARCGTGRRSRPLLRTRRSSSASAQSMAPSRATFARSNRKRTRARFCRNASGTWVRTPRSSTCTAWGGPYTVPERLRLTRRCSGRAAAPGRARATSRPAARVRVDSPGVRRFTLVPSRRPAAERRSVGLRVPSECDAYSRRLSVERAHWGISRPLRSASALSNLERGSAAGWKVLWDQLHHQGDVDTASYAAVPHPLRIYQARGTPDWNPYALVGTIEVLRGGRNPDVPPWLEPGYSEAVRTLAQLGSRELWQSDEREFVQCALALIALVRGHRLAGQLLLM